MKWVVYDDPDVNGRNIRERISVESAIAQAKEVAGRDGFVYKSDQEALDDFLTIHWAWIKED